jgi:phosphoserine phosphatase
MSKYKLALFDMDGTLLRERGIFVIAEKLGFTEELYKEFGRNELEFYQRSIEIAKLSKGYSKNNYLKIFRKIPYNNGVEIIIKELKKRDIKTGIITDSYQFLADDLKNRLNMDYAFGNNLITKNDIITGELFIHNTDLVEEFWNNRIYSICKSCILEDLVKKLGISVEQTLAIGDGIVDIGMIKKAGLGIAFNAKEEVQKHADLVISDMEKILEYI